MKILYTLIFGLLIISCSKRTLINNNQYNMMIGGYSSLNGSVKEIIEVPYKLVNDSLIPFEGEWPWDYKAITTFNKKRQMESQELYDESGLWLSRKFFYQSKNQLIPDSIRTDFSRKSFDDLILYEYSSDENNLTIKLYRDSKLYFTSNQTYDENFIPIKIIEGGKKPNSRVYQTRFKNDTLHLEYQKEDQPIYSKIFKLNKNKDWIWMEQYYKKNSKTKSYRYSYEYDKKANWTTKKIYDSLGQLLFVYKREINYN